MFLHTVALKSEFIVQFYFANIQGNYRGNTELTTLSSNNHFKLLTNLSCDCIHFIGMQSILIFGDSKTKSKMTTKWKVNLQMYLVEYIWILNCNWAVDENVKYKLNSFTNDWVYQCKGFIPTVGSLFSFCMPEKADQRFLKNSGP